MLGSTFKTWAEFEEVIDKTSLAKDLDAQPAGRGQHLARVQIRARTHG